MSWSAVDQEVYVNSIRCGQGIVDVNVPIPACVRGVPNLRDAKGVDFGEFAHKLIRVLVGNKFDKVRFVVRAG